MWTSDTHFWLEGIVGITRAFLFLLIISIMTGANIRELQHKSFWEKLANSCSNTFNKNWPYGFIAQITAFIVLLYGLGNGIIIIISALFIPFITWMGISPQDPNAAYNACVYFLKNLSVIPLAMVYILNICGVRSTN
ncbi:hypothetical protein [Cytobacillus sp. AMY 15.2]|uniref:hypothetical protein n=1 Tax=Cytobacillus sp. AMY 15.2 TaxID=2939563 RepID=UPI00203CD993|nr:hypothetical protein [Cytobacillus sp. AMY 15.2]